jgi:hypothetical protein
MPKKDSFSKYEVFIFSLPVPLSFYFVESKSTGRGLKTTLKKKAF